MEATNNKLIDQIKNKEAMINHFIDQVKNLEGTNLQLIAKIKNEDATNKMIERAKKELLIQLAKRNSTNNSGNSNSKFKFSLF